MKVAEVRQNILYVTQSGLYLHHELEMLKVKKGDDTILSLPLHHLQGIVIFGVSSMSPFLMRKCLERNIHVAFLTENGRFLGMIHGSFSGNILLRYHQFQKSQEPFFRLKIARSLVAGKIQNQRQLLLRRARESKNELEEAQLREAANFLGSILQKLPDVDNLDSLRGLEGESTKRYFQCLNFSLLRSREEFSFDRRTRRPPRSRINALLSFTYTLLTNDYVSACLATGLDPYCGYYHTLRPGRPALALDLMEELRPFADRFVLSLINLRQINPDDIEERPGGTYFLRDHAKKVLLKAWQERKHEEITHDYLGQKCMILELPMLQARILARTIRGDIETYVPYLWR
ncbi:MAG: type I-C CRISPR-associated endonuclease Cas1c [Leptospiraceae bacterium]|nr:type I-C CRISPR-associated endonuclease Cas1c [Leptospiraceae bacterium]MDW8305812.1 type I-C CRISPR-associated endonuclease Cas1c [Leptospiraceae bacterium]